MAYNINFNWKLYIHLVNNNKKTRALVALPKQIDNTEISLKSMITKNPIRKCKLIEHCQKSANNQLIRRCVRIVDENFQKKNKQQIACFFPQCSRFIYARFSIVIGRVKKKNSIDEWHFGDAIKSFSLWYHVVHQSILYTEINLYKMPKTL